VSSLEVSQLERVEETLWICLRMLEERRNLLNMTAGREEAKGFSKTASLQRQRAKETGAHIERIREILISSTTAMPAGMPAKH
jgi:two-component system, chemotaxis family, protein-glutamate methylesterase/glutaminase